MMTMSVLLSVGWVSPKNLKPANTSFRSEYPDQRVVEDYLGNFRKLFPRLPGFHITANVRKVRNPGTANAGNLIVEEVNIPLPFYLAALIEDADYFSPIWLNSLALGLWMYRIFMGY